MRRRSWRRSPSARSLTLPPLAAQTAVSGSPSEARTLVEVLEWHVAHHPDRVHVTLLEDDARHARHADLWPARRGATARSPPALIERDIVPGDRIALMLPTSLEFFIAFFGILYAGAVPVPIYPPARLSQIEEHLRRQVGILRNAGARILITVPEGAAARGAAARPGRYARRGRDRRERLSSDAPTRRCRRSPTARRRRFIQYTSGQHRRSQGRGAEPRQSAGQHPRRWARALQATSADVFVSWLPLYHDMGLIGAWLGMPLLRARRST